LTEAILKSSRKFQALSDSRGVEFRERLLTWYDAYARDLPWRKSRDPYRVWLSEIMLQQTRVAAVIDHYHEFLRRFPTIEKLAGAREASVLAAWSGLGYYRRARMLHAAAKLVVRNHGGKFPATAAELLTLPGVGRYTAAALASIAFGEPVAVVDGNVERVLQRLEGQPLAGETLWDEAEKLLDRERPGDFNQSMMELGARVCTPRAPACLACPVLELCATRGELPGAAKAAPQKKSEIHYVLDLRNGASRGSKVFLVRRPRDASLMAGMWELPELAGMASEAEQFSETRAAGKANARIPAFGRRTFGWRSPSSAAIIPSSSALAFASEAAEPSVSVNRKTPSNRGRKIAAPKALCPPKAKNDCADFTLKHSITVTDYTVRVWRRPAPKQAQGKWIPLDQLPRVALTGLARKILRHAERVAERDQAV
jgi:A/G-specific adenine glycosylase